MLRGTAQGSYRHSLLVVAAEHGGEPAAHLGDRMVHAFSQLLAEFAQFGAHLFRHGFAQYAESSSARRAADVGEAEKVKGLGLSPAALLSARCGVPSEFDKAGFVVVQFQVELAEAFSKGFEKTFGLVLVLEPYNESRRHNERR